MKEQCGVGVGDGGYKERWGWGGRGVWIKLKKGEVGNKEGLHKIGGLGPLCQLCFLLLLISKCPVISKLHENKRQNFIAKKSLDVMCIRYFLELAPSSIRHLGCLVFKRMCPLCFQKLKICCLSALSLKVLTAPCYENSFIDAPSFYDFPPILCVEIAVKCFNR